MAYENEFLLFSLVMSFIFISKKTIKKVDKEKVSYCEK